MADHLNIKTKMASKYSQRLFASQPITRVFMLRWPAFLAASNSIVENVQSKYSL